MKVVTPFELTKDESWLVLALATDRRSRFDLLASYAIYFLPLTVFGGYGMLRADLLALSMAFVSAIAGAVWYVNRQMNSYITMSRICEKLQQASKPEGSE